LAKEVISEAEERFEQWRKLVGLVLGPALFILLLMFPSAAFTPAGAKLGAVLTLALVWWMCEPIPIPVTALLAPALCVVLGISDAKALLAGFADPIVFLFIGSFILAQAMQLHQLDRRLAMRLLSLRWVGNSTTRVIFCFGAISAFLSMWLSNTATTAMMLPIALGILTEIAALMERQSGKPVSMHGLRVSTALMLMLAYAASIGGLGTPIGTPPNLIGIGQIRTATGLNISFLGWMQLAVPIVVIMFLALFALILVLHPPEIQKLEGLSDYLRRRREELGGWSRGQVNTLFAFAVAVVLWIAPGIISLFEGGTIGPIGKAYGRLLPEGIIAILAASLLFLLPTNWKQREFTISWSEAVKIDWGTILLFGSGIALGQLAFSTGLANAVGQSIITATNVSGLSSITFFSATMGVLVSEATSNTASATMVIPVVLAVAKQAGVSPVAPGFAACMGSSYGFMLPVSTAPNAIVYGTGLVPITKMARTGILFDLLGLVIIWAGVLLLSPLVR